MGAENEKVILNGTEKAGKLVHEHIVMQLMDFSDRLIHLAQMEKDYSNLTGNTVTSYMCGIYFRGKLTDVILDDGIKPPIRVKLTKGERFHGISYDGRLRDFVGEVATDRGYGDDFSMKFLAKYKPSSDGYAMVMCTGTEYSEFLERSYHFNVLTEISAEARRAFLNSFKPMADA